ncbi:EamA-like transporter family protein [Edaphobacter modestus]|uniref:EamA-like transporter family protein n=2 Tax=Edaphobacter modestus TaxID=388466 RepID=A0A4Q7YZS8_9BACT|nr:EamA-like transporter family protein [Edaphobacter modestus]
MPAPISRMKHALRPSQYAVLVTIMLTASVGDTLLSRGMAQVGQVDLHHLGLLWHALFNPFVISGIVLLIGFFASYMTALSWADLTFVMPATAFGYVVLALLSRFWLHEHLSVYRWAGIFLIVCAVGFVAGGPSRTEEPASHHELDVMDSGAGR